MPDAYIIDAVRTPRGVGKQGGALAAMLPQHLAVTVLSALRDRNAIDTADVGDVIWGVSAQQGLQAGDMARMAALDAGYDLRVSGVTIDRFCGSGLTAVALGAALIRAGDEELVVAGGTEMWSTINAQGAMLAEHGVPRTGPGTSNPRLQLKFPQIPQGLSADLIASIEGIGREDLDRLALVSHGRAARALAEGRFVRSTVPVIEGDTVVLDHEEFPRTDPSLEKLAALKPSFAAFADHSGGPGEPTYRELLRRIYPDVELQHVHHAGNSSGVVDAAAAVLVASQDYASAHGLKTRARVVACTNIGNSPTLMLNAPGQAARKVLAKAGLSIDDIDVWEVNEAFAVVVEKFIRDLGIDRDKININGGGISLGHPIGASGPILVGAALDELERSGGRYALVTMCTAGGMAPAMILERV